LEAAASSLATEHLRSTLSGFDAATIVAGSMIGSGIFIVSADIARHIGSPFVLLMVWLVSGLMTIGGALAYGELAVMMPHAGGQYVYLREAYGPLWAFLFGWTLLLVIQTGIIAAVAVAFARFVGVLVPALNSGGAVGSGWHFGFSRERWRGLPPARNASRHSPALQGVGLPRGSGGVHRGRDGVDGGSVDRQAALHLARAPHRAGKHPDLSNPAPPLAHHGRRPQNSHPGARSF
jgi:Amino acid permease